MKVLLDHCVPRRFGQLLPGHDVHTASALQWEQLKNGALLQTAAAAGFMAMITVDQNLRHQQALKSLPLAVIVVCAKSNDFRELSKAAPMVLAALERLTERTLIEIPVL